MGQSAIVRVASALTPRAFEALVLLFACAHCSGGEPNPDRSNASGGRDAGGSHFGGTNAQGGSSAGSSATTGGGSGAGGGGGPPTGGSSHGGESGSAATGGGSAGAGAPGTSGGAGSASGGAIAAAGGASAGNAPGGGMGGEGLQAGSGGQIAGDRCNFRVEHAQSSAIGTVTIVTWSTDLRDLTEARIDFGPTGAEPTLTAPVDLEQEGNRTLLLGMKTASDYSFRIVASSATETCTSPSFDVTTGPLPDNVPTITRSDFEGKGVEGYFLTTPGIGVGQRGLPSAYIFDTDGDVVWWSPESVEHMASARMSWDGRAMWIVNANGGTLYRITMDGLATQAFIGEAVANHDVAPLPEGGVATFGRIDGKHLLMIVNDDGTVEPVVDLAEVYAPSGGSYHPNALTYHPADDSFTLSDLSLDGFVKVERNGELVWQLGGPNPLGRSFGLVGIEPWDGNHGHELGPAGQFLFFNNFPDSGGSRVVQLELDEEAGTATLVWDFSIPSTRSQYLGGTQRLPNDNTSVVLSQAGIIYEVNPHGELVRSFSNTEYNASRDVRDWAVFGYAHFRSTLYGPPVSTWH